MKRLLAVAWFLVITITGSLPTNVWGQGLRTAAAFATVVNGFVVAVTVTDAGMGYTNAPIVTISGGGGSGAMAVAAVSNGVVVNIIVEDAGHEYTNAPTVTISAPPGPPEEDLLMPGAVVLARGTLSGATVNLTALLNDASLDAQQVRNYAVWQKPLTSFNSHPTFSEFSVDPFPASVTLMFALAGDTTFYVGAAGPVPDVLAVIGTFCWETNSAGLWDSFSGPTNWRIDAGVTQPDDGVYDPKDIGLVGMAFGEFCSLSGKGYLSGLASSDSDFRNGASIAVKHKLAKPVWIVYYAIFAARGDEFRDYGVGLPMNAMWCPFATIYDNGTATRSADVAYQGQLGCYTYASLQNNNSEQSWIVLDGIETLHQIDWGVQIKKYYNTYPRSVGLGGIKTWSCITPAISITAVADTVTVTNWAENPSLGQRRNPAPDVLQLPPNVWLQPIVVVVPPPKLSLQILAGYPVITLSGEVGTNYVIQYKNKLSDSNWTPLINFNLSANPFTFFDTSATGVPSRFYRAYAY
jgi:hypothetical protein